jgi:hypothetical protein
VRLVVPFDDLVHLSRAFDQPGLIDVAAVEQVAGGFCTAQAIARNRALLRPYLLALALQRGRDMPLDGP